MFNGFPENWNSTEPVYRQIAAWLKEAVLSGKYPGGAKLPPETELAASLKVNRITLRKSLDILKEQHLITQQQGRGTFISRQTKRKVVLGVINFLPNEYPFYDRYFSDVYLSVTAFISSHPHTMLRIIPWTYPQNKKEFFHQVTECDALLIPGSSNDKMHTLLDPAAGTMPKVFLSISSRKVRTSGYISMDQKKGELEKAVRQLHELGHRRIAFCGPTFTDNFLERASTFWNCVKKYHLEFYPEYYYEYDGNMNDLTRDFTISLMTGVRPPTAIISAVTGAGVVKAAMRLGFRIPEQLSVISFDEHDIFLTNHLKLPAYEMTGKACSLLLEAVISGTFPKERHFEYEAQMIDNSTIGKVCCCE